jgi:hypothetical protein
VTTVLVPFDMRAHGTDTRGGRGARIGGDTTER